MSIPTVSKSEFDEKLQSSKRLVLKFTAVWCGPCRSFTPIVEAVAKNHPDIEFVEVDVDKAPELAAQWGIRSIPTTIGFKDGVKAFQFLGAVSANDLERHLTAL